MPSVDYKWNGSQNFRMNGVAITEDTLRIKSNYTKSELMLRLILPTLCITYADMKFQNAIGGEQLNYPDSRVYGPKYFHPPVVIGGEKEIERLTYIRGARRVEIGEKQTSIEFPSWKELVIPRMRLSKKDQAEIELQVPETTIQLSEPLKVDIRQYADGRQVGGVSLKKPHPDWTPKKVQQIYDISIHVIDGIKNNALPKMEVVAWHWDPADKRFQLDKKYYTDEIGYIHDAARPSGELEAFVMHLQGHRAVVRCFRPLAGQKVRLHMKVWPMGEFKVPYAWNSDVSLSKMAEICGHSADAILKINGIKEEDLKASLKINLPCYLATYYLESWDNLDRVGQTFGYKDAKGLAQVNKVVALTGAEAINLPDWIFLYGAEKVTLDEIDHIFGLPTGSSRTVGRTYHPDLRLPYIGETVAVPSALFAGTL
ncbi:MAG: hypothetical protein NTZ34_00320 [Chloroflexi bacterium]|nr:hypothetical protein [Chloroflexota bacterium]